MFQLQNGAGEEHENLRVVDVFVDGSSEESLRCGALKVLRHVRPDWDLDNVCFKTFTDGITNQLVGCWEGGGTLGEDAVLLRIYGQKTELFIDRSAEVTNMLLLHAHGLAAPLHCAFRNGLCYGYNTGRVGDTALVCHPHISKNILLYLDEYDQHKTVPVPSKHLFGRIALCRQCLSSANNNVLIAQTLARMHSLKLCKGGRKAVPSLFPTMRKYLSLIPTEFADLAKNERFMSCIPSKLELEREVRILEEHLSELGSPVVFCHNDLLVKNIIYQETEDKVIFIDFEYADNNYQALDIGNHFCEFGGVAKFDTSLYPTREFQLSWLRHYLEEWYGLVGRGQVTDDDVQLLYVQVNKFALASCMFWSLWALIQAAHSTIKFDFLQFAVERLDLYNKRKTEFMELEIPPRS